MRLEPISADLAYLSPVNSKPNDSQLIIITQAMWSYLSAK